MGIKRQFAKFVGVCLLAALGWTVASAQAAALTITSPDPSGCAECPKHKGATGMP